MGSILDKDGKPTVIRPGNVIVYFVDLHYLALLTDSASGIRMRWANGDDKMQVPFIRSERDFFAFVEILSQTHGLSFTGDWRREYGPAYLFLKL